MKTFHVQKSLVVFIKGIRVVNYMLPNQLIKFLAHQLHLPVFKLQTEKYLWNEDDEALYTKQRNIIKYVTMYDYNK